MTALAVDAARLIERPQLHSVRTTRYLEDQDAWLAEPLPETEIDFLVAGSPTSADAACIALLNRVCNELPALEAIARRHLREFLNASLLESLDAWNVIAVEAGCGEARRSDQVALIFSDPEDAYGQWSVTMQQAGGRFFSVAFSRRQT